MTTKAIAIQQYPQDGYTVIWYNVNGEEYGVCNKTGEYSMLDCDGCPIELWNDRDSVLDTLMPHQEDLDVEFAGEDCEIDRVLS